MAKLVFIQIFLIFVSFSSSVLALTVNDLLGFGYLRQSRPEEPPRVVEVVRWRQAVCLTPAPGILPCLVGLENAQPSQHVQEHYSHGSSYESKQHLRKNKKDDHLLKTLTKDDSAQDSLSLESIEEDKFLRKRTTRAIPTPKLYSPRVVKYVKLENMGPSTLGDDLRGARRSRYLRLGPGVGKSTKRQTVYVTKVVDSPVVATLVASTCLPDIGIPLCDEMHTSQQNSAPSQYQGQPSQQNYVPSDYQNQPSQQSYVLPQYQVDQPQQRPPSSEYQSQPPQQSYVPPQYQVPQSGQIPSPSHHEGQYSQQNPGESQYYQYDGAAQQFPKPPLISDSNSGHHPSTPAPNIIQNIADFWTRPQVVQTNEAPEVKPVVVYQQPPPPGIFDGINAFLMPNGSWFGIFNFNNSQPGFPGIQFPQLPQIPTLQDILYRPENEIPQPPTVLDIFNLTSNQNSKPGAGPPTQSPGVFGGLFASPNKPPGATYSTTTTTTTTTTAKPQPSFLDGINNIFRPTNKPLVIESPDKKPIVIEKPIYVAEQPVIPGIFDIFQNPDRPVHLDSDKEPWVIKDPVYVLQKPNMAPQIFGVQLPDLNIFGSSSTTMKIPTKTTTTTTTTPQPYSHHYSNPPRAIPEAAPIDSEPIFEPESSLDSKLPENSKSGAYVNYGATSTPVYAPAPDYVPTPSPSYEGGKVEAPLAIVETDRDQVDLLDKSLQEIAHAEGEKETVKTTDPEYVGKDASKTSELIGNHEDEKIEEQIDNEA